MKKIILAGFLGLILFKPVFAEEYVIAHGENPQGKSYFAHTGLVFKKEDAGWQNNAMSNGIFEVILNDGILVTFPPKSVPLEA